MTEADVITTTGSGAGPLTDYHRRILDAIRTHDAEAARRAMPRPCDGDGKCDLAVPE